MKSETISRSKSRNNIRAMVVSAMLCAIGIAIPMVSPIKIVLEPASFTLGSHIAIFIGMFIMPSTAIAVSIGTTLGFLLAGFPIVVVLRAGSHVLFAAVGALYLRKFASTMDSPKKFFGFGLWVSIVHALAEVFVVSFFYFGNTMNPGYYAKGFFYSVILLVGIGTIVHSMVDLYLAKIIWSPISKAESLVGVRN